MSVHHGDHLESVTVRLNRRTDETLTPAQRAALRATVERALTMSSEVAQELDLREREIARAVLGDTPLDAEVGSRTLASLAQPPKGDPAP